MKSELEKKLTQAEKAVAVAKDVIKQLRWINATSGKYLDAEIENKKYTEKDDMQSAVKDIRKDCECCLLGACLLSKANLFNNVPLRNILSTYEETSDSIHVSRNFIVKKLHGIFSQSQLELMESAFEGTFFTYFAKNKDLIYKSGVYRFKEPNSKKRIKVVMRNIIRNKGIFIPNDYD